MDQDLTEKIMYQKFKDIDYKMNQQQDSIDQIKSSVDSLAACMQEQFRVIMKLIDLDKETIPRASSPSKPGETDFRQRVVESWVKKKIQEENSKLKKEQKRIAHQERIQKNDEKLKRNVNNRKQLHETRLQLAQELLNSPNHEETLREDSSPEANSKY